MFEVVTVEVFVWCREEEVPFGRVLMEAVEKSVEFLVSDPPLNPSE